MENITPLQYLMAAVAKKQNMSGADDISTMQPIKAGEIPTGENTVLAPAVNQANNDLINQYNKSEDAKNGKSFGDWLENISENPLVQGATLSLLDKLLGKQTVPSTPQNYVVLEKAGASPLLIGFIILLLIGGIITTIVLVNKKGKK